MGGAGFGRGAEARAPLSLMAADFIYGKQPVARGRTGAAARCAGSGGRRRPRRRSWSGSAARPTTRASSPRSTPIPTATRSALLRQEGALLVALDQVQDPRNLGAVCRSAEFAGAAGVVVPERRAAAVTAAACKASAGAVEHLAVAHVRNLADWLAEAKEAGFWIWGADADADATALGRPTSPARPCSSSAARARACAPASPPPATASIALPRHGQVESLNVSAAATALLFEAVRQRS